MGVAIIIPGIKFGNEYGKVNLSGDRPIRSLEIISEDSYAAPEVQLSVRLNPLTTTQRKILWSITSGGEYATINENGKITVDASASSASVTVKAEAELNNGIYDTKTITLTYDAPVTLLEKVSITGYPTINTGCKLSNALDSIEMKYKVTGNPGSTGMLWGTLDEHSAAYYENSSKIIVDFLADNDRNPITKGTIIHYNGSTRLGNILTDEFFIDEVLRNGSTLTPYATLTGSGTEESGDIYILHPTSSYKFNGIDIYYFRIKRNGEVLHDFRPAEKGGVYGFYDIIGKVFISNTGNGTITA